MSEKYVLEISRTDFILLYLQVDISLQKSKEFTYLLLLKRKKFYTPNSKEIHSKHMTFSHIKQHSKIYFYFFGSSFGALSF